MDEVEKSKIRLTHWIDHNMDHLKGYAEVAEVLEREGLKSAGERIRRGMRLIEEANAEFQNAIAEIFTERKDSAPGPSKQIHEDPHDRPHTHEHIRGHGDTHSHDHGHTHGHGDTPHTHPHSHGHGGHSHEHHEECSHPDKHDHDHEHS